MYLTCSIAWLTPMNCELMGQAHRDDTIIEVSGPVQPELTDEDA